MSMRFSMQSIGVQKIRKRDLLTLRNNLLLVPFFLLDGKQLAIFFLCRIWRKRNCVVHKQIKPLFFWNKFFSSFNYLLLCSQPIKTSNPSKEKFHSLSTQIIPGKIIFLLLCAFSRHEKKKKG